MTQVSQIMNHAKAAMQANVAAAVSVKKPKLASLKTYARKDVFHSSMPSNSKSLYGRQDRKSKAKVPRLGSIDS